MAFKDNDKLDMPGDWDLFWRNNFDQTFTFNAKTSAIHRVRFTDAGEGSLNGRKFKGKFVDPEGKLTPFVFEGETFYDHRGVQLMQMRARVKGVNYVQVYAGYHVFDAANPNKIWGAAFDCGPELDKTGKGTPVPLVFQLLKVLRPKSK